MREALDSLIEEINVCHHVIIIIVCLSSMMVAMTVDLISGVAKAKKMGIATTSTGYKKTVDKARKYFSPFVCLVVMDFICAPIVPLPFFSMLWAFYCVFCEFISVRENAWKKEELRKQEKTMSLIIDNKDEIANMFMELLRNARKDETDKELHA